MKRKTKVAQRMWHIHLIDTELERGLCALKVQVKEKKEKDYDPDKKRFV